MELPAATWENASPPMTGTGAKAGVSEYKPFPSAPQGSVPQQYAASLRVMPQVWPAPVASVLNRSPPLTGTGTGLSVVEPSPSWPYWSLPQQYAAPLAISPHAFHHPAVSAVKLRPPATPVGTRLDASEPLPSCPWSLRPQQYAAPVPLASPQVNSSPPANAVKVSTATEIVAIPLCPSLVAVTATDPGPTAVTRPFASTVATAASWEIQMVGRGESTFPFASRSVAASCTVP